MLINEIKQIGELLERSAPEKRTRLLDFVSTICRENGRQLSNTHINMLGHLAENLIDRVSHDTLVDAANVFAHLDNAPESLIHSLVAKEIEIAEPVLKHSPVLTDESLFKIIQNFDEDYKKAVAQRTKLTNPVTDCLIDHSNNDTLLLTIQNQGASFSKKGFKQLSLIGNGNQNFAEALCIRQDMPEEMAQPLLQKFDIIPTQKPKRNASSIKTEVRTEARKAQTIRKEQSLFLPLTKTMIQQINRGNKSFDDCIVELCKIKNEKVLCQLLAERSKTSETNVTAAFSHVEGTRFIQLCKTLKMSRKTFEQLATFRTKQAHLPNSQVFYLMRQFDTMTSHQIK